MLTFYRHSGESGNHDGRREWRAIFQVSTRTRMRASPQGRILNGNPQDVWLWRLAGNVGQYGLFPDFGGHSLQTRANGDREMGRAMQVLESGRQRR